MGQIHRVLFYPVGNGDTSQVVLDSGRRILFDFCHRDRAEGESIPEIDLKARLAKELKDTDRDYFDVVAFTHADSDHIMGSTTFFELLHAVKYQGHGRIKIRELWVPAAMLLEDATHQERSEEFVILRQEARYRLLEGKGIRVFSRPPLLIDWLSTKLRERGLPADARDEHFVDAGTLVPGFTLASDGAELFCHSPFIEHTADGDFIRNSAALVFDVRLSADGTVFDYLEIGDAVAEDLEKIVVTTDAHGNNHRLRWDVLNIPHHCSYLSLANDKGKIETIPLPKVKALLDRGNEGSYVVSCSKPIPDTKAAYEQIQPPHIQARKAYERHLKTVNGRRFLVTMEEPNEKRPEAIVFEVTGAGFSWVRSRVSGAAATASTTPPRAGQ